jgi:single-stranded DNA-binding protein
MRSISASEIRDQQNRRPERHPFVTVRRMDGRYHVLAKIDGLEHTHKVGYKAQDVAWNLVKRVRRHLDQGHDLNLAHWDTEDPDPFLGDSSSEGTRAEDSEARPAPPSMVMTEVTVPIRTGLLTLTGFLGHDPESRETEAGEVTGTRTRRQQFIFQNGSHSVCDQHDVVEDDEEYSFVKPPRGYAVLSVATHSTHRGQISTEWHRVIAWNTDRDHFGLFRLGKGDQVELIARPSTYTTRDGRDLEQLELVRFRLLRRKLRQICE